MAERTPFLGFALALIRRPRAALGVGSRHAVPVRDVRGRTVWRTRAA